MMKKMENGMFNTAMFWHELSETGKTWYDARVVSAPDRRELHVQLMQEAREEGVRLSIVRSSETRVGVYLRRRAVRGVME